MFSCIIYFLCSVYISFFVLTLLILYCSLPLHHSFSLHSILSFSSAVFGWLILLLVFLFHFTNRFLFCSIYLSLSATDPLFLSSYIFSLFSSVCFSLSPTCKLSHFLSLSSLCTWSIFDFPYILLSYCSFCWTLRWFTLFLCAFPFVPISPSLLISLSLLSALYSLYTLYIFPLSLTSA